MTETNKAFCELVSVLKDGATFYEQAKDKVDDAELKALFVTMAEIRVSTIDALKFYIERDGGEADIDGTLAGAMRRFYTETLSLVNDTDRSYIAQLEEHEDRTLEAFDKAQGETDDAELISILTANRLTFEGTHETMRALKKVA